MEQGRTHRLIAGCMTGTSLDGIDAALVAIEGRGLSMRPRLLGLVSGELGSLREELMAMASGQPRPALAFLRAARALGQVHADVLTNLCSAHLPAGQTLDFVVAHGQTIWHAPDEGLSWQLMDPWPVVRQLGVPVLYDLRQADLIAGGQGAPITPMSDWIMYRHPQHDRLIVNLGGICNVTHLPAGSGPEQVTGGDIGPCNLLIDGLVKTLYPDLTFDRDGAIARSGMVHPQLAQWVFESPFFARKLPHSTGREDFDASWLQSLLTRAKTMGWSSPDIIASAVDAVAQIIIRHRQSLPGECEVILAGGGARNRTLLEHLKTTLNQTGRVLLSDELGIPLEAREAMAFAVLGALSQDGIPITLPAVTGASNPGKAGVWAFPS